MKNIRLSKNDEYLYPATKDENIIRKENNFIKKLYTGLLVNGDVNTSTSAITSNSHRVVMRNNIVLPYMGVTLCFRLPEDIKVKVYTSDDFMKMSGTNSDTNKVTYGWFKNGDSWTAKKEINVNSGNNWQTGIKSEMQYRIMFCRFDGTKEVTKQLSVDEIQSLIDEDKILITYRDYSDSIITRNYANEANIRWAFTDRNTTGQPYTKRLPAIAHVSDLHGDYYRWKNCMEYCDYLGIQAVVVSGDILAQNTNDGYNWFIDVQKEHPNIKVLAVAGNHDHDGDTKYWNREMLPTIAEVQRYDDYDQDSGNWYIYVESINTHFIGLDLYRGGSFKPSINDTDLQYLEDHIAEIIDSGVKSNLVIVTHSSEVIPDRLIDDVDDWYSDMYTDDYMTQFSSYGNTPKLTNFLQDFIDSNNSVLSFKCLLTGHLHRNLLGSLYKGDAGSIFEFKATIDNAISCNQRDSINGDGYGIVQDNFSIYGFVDEDIRISRVGSIVTTGGKVQDRVQLNKYGYLLKNWSTPYIILHSTYELNDSNRGTFTITSNNADEAFNEKNKNVPKFLEIEGMQNILPLALINDNEHLDGVWIEALHDGEITGYTFVLRKGETTGTISPIGRYAFVDLPKLNITEDYTLTGYESWNYSEMFEDCFKKIIHINFNDNGSYIVFNIIKTKTGISLRSNNFLLNGNDYYISGEYVNGKFSLNLNTTYQKPSSGIPATDLSTDLQDKVKQISPKEALFIDLWNDAAKPFDGKYNKQTGYYEMNGLTDITYEEALQIYNHQVEFGATISQLPNYYSARTVCFKNCPCNNGSTISYLCYYQKTIKVINLKGSSSSTMKSVFEGCVKLEKVIGMRIYNNFTNSDFQFCRMLSTLEIIIAGNYNVVIQDSPLLSYDSINYMITKSLNTDAITITVHPNTYAYLQGTTAPIAEVGGTVEQWKALLTAATAKQISFAEGTPTT